MFHTNIYTQKTTAFQKNCGFSVPLLFKGFFYYDTKSVVIVTVKYFILFLFYVSV